LETTAAADSQEKGSMKRIRLLSEVIQELTDLQAKQGNVPVHYETCVEHEYVGTPVAGMENIAPKNALTIRVIEHVSVRGSGP